MTSQERCGWIVRIVGTLGFHWAVKEAHVLQQNRQRKRCTEQSSVRECEGGPALSSEERQPDRSSAGRTEGGHRGRCFRLEKVQSQRSITKA